MLASELLSKLDNNLRREHRAVKDLGCFFGGKVLTRQQFANMCVHSYPYFLDMQALTVMLTHLAKTAPEKIISPEAETVKKSGAVCDLMWTKQLQRLLMAHTSDTDKAQHEAQHDVMHKPLSAHCGCY